MSTARVKVALVGVGSMGRNHARVISEHSGAELQVIIDPSQDAGQETADRFATTWSPDLEAARDADAVVIAAPTEHHFSIAESVLAMGKPVLIEKPICPSLEQTLEVIDLSRQAGLPLMCGFLERYNPAVMVARRLIADPLFVRAERHSPYTPRIKTGVAWDLLVHDVDLITQLFGGMEPTSINVEAGQFHPLSVPGAEDIVETSLSFPSGGLASASASRLGQRKVRNMVVQTLENTVEIDLLRRGVTSYRHTTIEGADDIGGAGFRQATEIEVPEIFGKEPLVAQLDRFLALIDGKLDLEAERESFIPAHRIVDRALSKHNTVLPAESSSSRAEN
jgi:predicted dehydrogenase